jgi:hypothetical protein
MREARILAHGQIGRYGAGRRRAAFWLFVRELNKYLILNNYFL